MTRLLPVLIAWSALVIAARGDIPIPPLAPYTADAGDPAAWTITYSSTAAASSPAKPSFLSAPRPASAGEGAIKEEEVTKVNDVRRIVTTWESGGQSEKWAVPGYVLLQQPGQKQIFVVSLARVDPGMRSGGFGYATADFPEMAWLSPAAFVAVETYNAVRCYHFKQAAPPKPIQPLPSHTAFHAKPIESEAWIDVTTKLPVALKQNGVLELYHFHPASGPLTLPQAFADALAHSEAIRKNPTLSRPHF